MKQTKTTEHLWVDLRFRRRVRALTKQMAQCKFARMYNRLGLETPALKFIVRVGSEYHQMIMQHEAASLRKQNLNKAFYLGYRLRFTTVDDFDNIIPTS